MAAAMVGAVMAAIAGSSGRQQWQAAMAAATLPGNSNIMSTQPFLSKHHHQHQQHSLAAAMVGAVVAAVVAAIAGSSGRQWCAVMAGAARASPVAATRVTTVVATRATTAAASLQVLQALAGSASACR